MAPGRANGLYVIVVGEGVCRPFLRVGRVAAVHAASAAAFALESACACVASYASKRSLVTGRSVHASMLCGQVYCIIQWSIAIDEPSTLKFTIQKLSKRAPDWVSTSIVLHVSRVKLK